MKRFKEYVIVWLNHCRRNNSTAAAKESVPLRYFGWTNGDSIAVGWRLVKIICLLLIAVLSLLACAEETPTATDEEPPTVAVTFPRSNTSVSGVVIIRVEATDNEAVVKVEFYINDALVHTGQTPPWECSWETIHLVNGSKHTIVAKAYDGAGNVSSSEEVGVVISNEINNPPTATISLPEDSTSFAQGEAVVFYGEGRDAMGNSLRDDQLSWFSDRDGYLGTGRSLERDDLSAEWHIITLMATDDRDLTGKDSTFVHISTEAELFQVTYDSDVEEFPCWSPDGMHIVYSSDRSGNLDLWIVSIAGGAPTQLTVDLNFDWEPDWYGSEILFTSYRSGNADIWKISETGGEAVQVTDHQGWDTSPAASSDGEHIVISSQMGGGGQCLWVLPMDDGDAEQVTTRPGYEPDWSVLGDIAFRSGDQNIYVTSLVGMTPVQITWDPARDMSPSWSPTGDAIAFTSDRSGNEDIWIWSFEEGRLKQLTFHSGRDYQPVWSPDGQWIAFVSDRNGSPDIWLIEVLP